MAKRNSTGFDQTLNADGFDMAGGTTPRKLTITGGDLTLTTSGSRTFTFPAANETVATLGQIQTFTAKQTFGADISVNGITINTNADGTIGSGDLGFSVTKNDSNTRTFHGLRVRPTLNTGGSNANTIVNLLEIDTINTATTGLTTNLLRANYGGTSRLVVTSAGSIVLGSAALATSAIDGFLYLNSTAGLPTGTPTTNTGRVPINVDTTSGRLYGHFSSGWKNLSSDFYNVIMYGADPTGTSDSLAAFQAARDAAKNSARGAGVVYLPAGIYKLSDTFQIGDGTSTTISTYHGIKIVGAGGNRLTATSTGDSVRITWSGAASGTMIKFAGPIGGVGIENVLIDCDNGASDAATGISVVHAEGFVCKNVQILNNSGVAFDVDSFDASTFTGQTVFNGGNTGLVDNLFINTSTNGASGVRLGANGNIAQWSFLGGRWRLDGTTGSSSIILQFADHNTFLGVTTQAATGLTVKPTAAHPDYPHNNIFYGSSINGSTSAVSIDNSAATWAPPTNIGIPFLLYPTADGAALPTDLRLFGLSDTKKFFGEFSFRDNATFEKKVLGDFNNPTHGSRTLFQSSTSGASYVGAIPNGAGIFSGFNCYSGSDANNASYGSLFANGTFGTILDSNKTGTGSTAPIYLQTTGNTGITVDALSATPNVVVGTAAAVGTSAVNGFLYIPTCAGTPSGTPSAYTGKSPLIIDSTNHILYYNDGTWRNVAGAGGAPFSDSTAIVKGSVTDTKLLRFEVDGFTAATTRVATWPDADLTVVGTDTTQVLTNKTLDYATNTIIVSLSDLDPNISDVSFSQAGFNTTYNHTTGLWATAWSGNTLTSSMFTVSSTNTSATGYLLDVVANSATSSVKPLRLQAKQNTVLDTDAFGNITLSPRPGTTGSPTHFTFTGAAHTGLTAGAEIIDVNFALNRTIQRAAGSVSVDRSVIFQGRTLSFASASTVTDAINVDIASVTAGGSATITRSTGLRVKPSATTHHGLWVDGTVSYVADAGAFGLSGTKIIRFVGSGGTMNSVFNDNGALASSATDGFQYISRMDSASAPSGTPSSYNGSSPILLQSDTASGNYRLWTHLNSSWRNLTPIKADSNNNSFVPAGLGLSVVSKTANYTAANESVILCSAASGAIVITLPAASSSTDRVYFIKKTDSSANTVTIDPNASETIDGQTTMVLNFQNSAVTVICDGSGWFIF